jgi:LysM repeat protein
MSSLFVRIVGVLLAVSLLFPAVALAAPGASGETVHIVQWGETLSLIAKRYGITVDAILAANDLSNPDFVYVGQRLVIPVSGQAGPGGRHKVVSGETLTSIALRYGTTAAALAAANNLGNNDLIYVGQVLKVPGKAPGGSAPGSSKCANDYLVQWGDSLSGIALRHGTTANALMQANDLYSDFIRQGQRLCVPQGGVAHPQSAPSGEPRYHSVNSGDTMASIASRFGVSQADILQANNLAHESRIQPGQRLIIPGAHEPTAGGPPGADGTAPGRPTEYQPGAHEPTAGGPPGANGTAPGRPPEYQPPEKVSGIPRSSEPVVIRSEPQWVGSQSAHGPDPDEITTLLVMAHEGEGLDVMIRSRDGFVARGYTGVYYEYSWVPTFAFRNIPGGEYEVWIEGQPSRVVEAKVDPGHRALVEFKWKPVSTDLIASPAGWVGEVVENTSGTEPIGAFSILVVRTGAIGNKVRVTAPGGYEAICITGTKLEHGAGACDVGGLNAGTYQVILDGADVTVEVYLDGIGTATVEFRPA